ncbi:MAG: DNA cytosine methyltransferase [Lachnospiraceae bacterium]|nr:DNA cytosine methyltransferase [Lachnospiraceae bacterium]
MNVLDLFCGAGGLSCGFKMAGFEIVGGIDFEPSAIKTHEKNFPGGVNWCGDIRDFSNERIKSDFPDGVDVIIGGPPCQGFSSANMQQKDVSDDPRNRLFMEFIRFVEQLKPKAFMIENVRGILTKDGGFAKRKIYSLMENAGYVVTSAMVSASDYGVPQKRKRAVFVGIRKDLEREFDFDRLEKLAPVTVREAIGDLYGLEEEAKNAGTDCFAYHPEPSTPFQNMIFSTSGKIWNHKVRYPCEKVMHRMTFVPQGGNWRNVPPELWDTQRDNRHSSVYRRLEEDGRSVTIDTGHMNYFHPVFNRVPTVRESARLQSFPDDFLFEGKSGAQFKQVGNAVPPLLAYAVAKEIKRTLEGIEK